MEEAVTKEPDVKRPAPSLPPAPVRPAAPVMDVHRPAAASSAAPQPPMHQTDKADKPGGVHEAPKEDGDSKQTLQSEPAVVQGKAPKSTKSHQPGVGGAIAATVVIVLGLAALAVYAYLKSQ